MKSFTLFVSLLVALSLVLGACGPAATEAPAVATAAPATEAPVATEAPATEAPAVLDTEYAPDQTRAPVYDRLYERYKALGGFIEDQTAGARRKQ